MSLYLKKQLYNELPLPIDLINIILEYLVLPYKKDIERYRQSKMKLAHFVIREYDNGLFPCYQYCNIYWPLKYRNRSLVCLLYYYKKGNFKCKSVISIMKQKSLREYEKNKYLYWKLDNPYELIRYGQVISNEDAKLKIYLYNYKNNMVKYREILKGPLAKVWTMSCPLLSIMNEKGEYILTRELSIVENVIDGYMQGIMKIIFIEEKKDNFILYNVFNKIQEYLQIYIPDDRWIRIIDNTTYKYYSRIVGIRVSELVKELRPSRELIEQFFGTLNFTFNEEDRIFEGIHNVSFSIFLGFYAHLSIL